MLRAAGLACVRGERPLFSDISFTLSAGTLLEVRGPNGSGKTSLLRIVCGLLAPESGEISWSNRPIRELGEEYRANLAYVGHLNAVKDELDPAENLRHAARLAGLPAEDAALAEALAAFELDDCRHLPCKLLSQGQKRRVALARLKLSRARALWVLDEPLAALDARATQLARSLIEAHLAAGGIAILTLHQKTDISAPAVQRLELAP
jgi:heme exporter protein A